MEQLPLNGRNFLNLLFIGAGAVQTTGEQGQMRQGEGNAISINGGRPTSNNYTLDGLVNTDTALNTPAVILSQDAIQEFKVQSETYSAEYGFSANQVNIVSKSGTNQLHGTAFEFLRNDAFDAKAPFQSAIPELRQNQFGFVLGGPIYIPKVYDGRNKTFFLVNYEGWRIRNGINQDTFNVPNPAWLAGDFSASGLTPVTAGCIPSATTFCMPIDPTTGAPFPGNMIPSSSFSRLAQVAIGAGLFPAPNCLVRLSRKLSPDHRFAQHGRSADLQARPAIGPFRLDVLSLYHRTVRKPEHQRFGLASIRNRHLQRESPRAG